jgi:hypothetical protein
LNEQPATSPRRRVEATFLKTRGSGFVLNSFAGRLALVAAAGLSISTASAGTPPSLSGAIPGPIGKYAVKDAAGNKAVGVDGRVGIMVVLEGEPAAQTYRRALASAGSRGVTAATVAGAASRQAVNQLAGQQAQISALGRCERNPFEELFRAQRAINGIGMRVLPQEIERLAKLPGVARVEYLPYETPGNITSVPFIGAPQAWTGVSSLGLPFDATGSGVRVGIIDTGIDYLHPDFGGSGSLVDYQKNADRRHINPVDPENPDLKYFPTVKVAGGFDFVGDFYDGSNSPVPDPNPADCNGHGSHVAGTVAGYGVNKDGTPYAAGYDPLPNYSGFRIGPGVAPAPSSMHACFRLRWRDECSHRSARMGRRSEQRRRPQRPSRRRQHVARRAGRIPVRHRCGRRGHRRVDRMIVVAASGNNGSGFFVAQQPGSRQARDFGCGDRRRRLGRRAVARIVAGCRRLSGPLRQVTSTRITRRRRRPRARPDSSCSSTTGVDPPADGCESTFTGNVAGKIVLIDRGICNFTVKVLNAQDHGAKGVIVANNLDDAPPLLMGGIADSTIKIPAVGVSNATGAALKAQLATGDVKVALATASAGDTFASFSSRGPTIDVDGSVTLKPDLAAPGVDIPSVLYGRDMRRTGLVRLPRSPRPAGIFREASCWC